VTIESALREGGRRHGKKSNGKPRSEQPAHAVSPCEE
jgi:hypothetical protein